MRNAAGISATRCCCRAPDAPSSLPKLAADGRLELGPITLQRRGKAIASDRRQSALPQRRGPDHHRSDGNRGRHRHPRSGHQHRGAARRTCRAPEVCRTTHLRQPASTSRTSIAARFPISGTCSAISASCTSSCAASRGRTCCRTTCTAYGIEKLWVAAVESFAIGGHCQILLDDGLRDRGQRRLHDAAGAQGRHHPGRSNMRLPRFVGDRIARQAIQYGRRLDCDSPEGRMICDEIVPAERDGRSHRSRRRGTDLPNTL